MKKGKIALAGVVCTALTIALAVPVFAHSGHSHGYRNDSAQRVQTSVSVCTDTGCTASGRHLHDGWIYCGYDHENGLCDGSCSVPVCPYEDCAAVGQHLHHDITYCGYDHENGLCDGSCSVPVCSYEDCTISGRHFHDDTAYCGYNHAAGCRDNSSAASVSPHHGRHHRGR